MVEVPTACVRILRCAAAQRHSGRATQKKGCMEMVARKLIVPFAVFVLVVTAAEAQKVPGVTDNEILIGSCSALDGPAQFLGRQTIVGATAYLKKVNADGGVFGRKIQLLAFDDGYEPANAENCFKRLQKEGIFSAGFFVGTPTAAKYVPLAEANKVPVVGLFTGAEMLYTPLKHYVLNVRASYYDETREQVENLWNVLGIHKIGVIYQDDAFGQAVLSGLQLALKKLNAARPMNPGAVLIVGPYAPVAEIIKKAHATGWHPIFLTVSFVGTEKFISEAGKDAEGTVITQVVPPYTRTDFPTVALYRESLTRYYPAEQPNFVSLEGFVDAMVLVEGLKRAGKDLTREKLITALESIQGKDVGLGPKLTLKYSPSRHKGFDQIYTTVVRDGKPEILDDWKKLPH